MRLVLEGEGWACGCASTGWPVSVCITCLAPDLVNPLRTAVHFVRCSAPRVQIIDAMWKPSAYDWVYPLSYLFTFSIATPHSILVQLAFPSLNLKQGTASVPLIHHPL